MGEWIGIAGVCALLLGMVCLSLFAIGSLVSGLTATRLGVAGRIGLGFAGVVLGSLVKEALFPSGRDSARDRIMALGCAIVAGIFLVLLARHGTVRRRVRGG